ncbi:uncharacterized protein MONOS_2011 [Monocercomonoides exilis]|uniref:uncharacterized protein n=1 Tax=Monocercomonoides exilis TaxID=2049356 RepID=UPI003559AC23|nr:hypothetical protein MONOS_2011 [Monocercomonoides exilis]|eukprot:MONOS_2011.1-p1 / transcript=MONOS_2011.1 / gene=MONOS_2011 / organism=Monocercomonoides_exilis_PA203 / gene_product=unspecified product / transcript_product=unspecified product / location=Mono_scaffold00039:11969-13208(-) / protein_length=395 / sequence_SO=supercontig / SO=protein_coding / is_pseudo=false
MKMSTLELSSILKKENFDKINKMLDEKKLSLENAVVLLKCIGYCKEVANIWSHCFNESSLNERFAGKIIEEQKKEEKNEKLLIDLCECYLMLHNCIGITSKEIVSISVPCLLKVALNKEKSEETRKEVEMALLALRNIDKFTYLMEKLFLSEIKEIIQYHQEQRNLTRIAYQSAWQFLMCRSLGDELFKRVIENELHFGREVIRELEELNALVDWKRKDKEEKTNEEILIKRWLKVLYKCRCYFYMMLKEEFVELLELVTRLYRETKDCDYSMRKLCVSLLELLTDENIISDSVVSESGVVGIVLEELQEPTLDHDIIVFCLGILSTFSLRLNKWTDKELAKAEWKKIQIGMFEKMEEEGYEDYITSFHETLSLISSRVWRRIFKKSFDYYINI